MTLNQVIVGDYLMARLLGLRGGIDIARGPEDTAYYLTLGTAWGL